MSTSWGEGGYGEGLGTGRSDSEGMRSEVKVETMYRQRASMTRSLVSGVSVTENVEN